MRKLDFVGDIDPHKPQDYRNFVQNRTHRSPCDYARKLPSQGSRVLTSQATLRKHPVREQTVYNFAPLNETNSSAQNCTTNNISFEDGQLPHYVVPVLYIPQRIITNEELYFSDIAYDQYPSAEQIFTDGPRGTMEQSPSQSQPYYRNFADRPTSVSRHGVSSKRHLNMHGQLTDSETEMYDKLMAKLYGMERSEKELSVDNNFSPSCPYQASQLQVPEKVSNQTYITDGELSEYSNPSHSLQSENSSTSVASEYIRKQAASRVKASSFTQEFVAKVPTATPPCSPSTSSYTVYPMKAVNYHLHKPLKDPRIANLVAPVKSSYSCKSRHRESTAKLPKELVAPVIEEQSLFDSDLDFLFREGVSESKCTQTSTDMGTETQTGDHNVRGSYGYIQKPEKGPARKHNKPKTYDCTKANIAVVIDRGSNENVYTMLNSGSQKTKVQEEKFDKSTECFPTVDLLPVESKTFESLSKNMAFSKLPPHSRVPRVRNVKL